MNGEVMAKKRGETANVGILAGPDQDQGVTFHFLCDWFEEEYGRGWKRRLAEMAGVPESNVHSWIKAGKMPPWILRIFRLLIQNSRLQRNLQVLSTRIAEYGQCDQVIDTGDGYMVCRLEDGPGSIVASGITDEAIAREIAALPRLKSIANEALDYIAFVVDSGFLDMIPADEEYPFDTGKLLEALRNWSQAPGLRPDVADADIEDVAEALAKLSEQMTARKEV
jgi:hypothetical protein